MDRIAVLIPCYNEASTIEKVVKDFAQALPEAKIYVYANNCTDDTAEIAAKAGAIVRYEYLQGKGNVVRRMFREVDAECYVMTDGDDTYPAENAREMCDLVLGRHADMVVGDRLSGTYYRENKRRYHNSGNNLVRSATNRLFGGEIKDIMTGYRALSYNFVKTLPVLSKGFEIETEMSIHALFRRMQIENVVIEYRDRPEGSQSKLDTVPDGLKVLGTIRRLYRDYKPFKFFAIRAAILAVISIILFIPIAIEYMNTGLVPRFPTLFVSGMIMVMALLLLGAGLILNAQLVKDMRDFEFKLQEVENRHKRLLGF